MADRSSRPINFAAVNNTQLNRQRRILSSSTIKREVVSGRRRGRYFDIQGLWGDTTTVNLDKSQPVKISPICATSEGGSESDVDEGCQVCFPLSAQTALQLSKPFQMNNAS
jgi:hypothetical protein